MELDHGLLAQVELALANSKRAGRECNIVTKDLARIRDYLETVQPKEGTTNDNHSTGSHS